MRISDCSSDVCSSDLNVFNVTDRLAVTVGARWTHDKKKLDATFLSDNSACDAQRAALAGVRDNPAATPLARELAGDLITLSCLSNNGTNVDGDYSDSQSDNEWSGTLELGRAHVCNPVPNAHLVCRLLLEKKTDTEEIQC